MTAVLIILALDLAMLAYQWHRAAVEAQCDLLEAELVIIARSGRIAKLTRAVEAQRDELEWQSGVNRRDLQRLGSALVERDKALALVAAANEQMEKSVRIVGAATDGIECALIELRGGVS